MPSQTSASNRTTGSGPSTERSGSPVEPVKIGDRQSKVPARPPTPLLTRTNTGEESTDPRPLSVESTAQAMGVGMNSGHEIHGPQGWYSRSFKGWMDGGGDEVRRLFTELLN
ncbi:hypothetical protein V491_01488 [Pseudogymnoascus sp. VKM F-3775]|nr:hypothetical protein V491_01488 [Pseudogymnoascus sp. VKM F-3775]